MTGACVATALVPGPWAVAPRRERFVERWSWAMGQAVHVMVFADSEDRGLEACAAALAELRRVEDRLSLFADKSDLCELNRCAGKRPMHVDDDLRNALQAAEGFRRVTRGAFDPAVEPLMRTWGFHRPRQTAPSTAEIAEAREAVIAAVVRLDRNTVSLPSAHTQLDFGGIGVGYGIDRAIAVLRAHGIRRGFIDVSGDCYGMGAPLGHPEGWPVGIAGTSKTVYLRDTALATSSNTVSVIRLQGKLAGHIMNPATGYPADMLRQVTMVAPTASAADALSTGALVSGAPSNA